MEVDGGGGWTRDLGEAVFLEGGEGLLLALDSSGSMSMLANLYDSSWWLAGGCLVVG